MTLGIDLGGLEIVLSYTAIRALLSMVYQGNLFMKAAETLRERLVQQQYEQVCLPYTLLTSFPSHLLVLPTYRQSQNVVNELRRRLDEGVVAMIPTVANKPRSTEAKHSLMNDIMTRFQRPDAHRVVGGIVQQHKNTEERGILGPQAMNVHAYLYLSVPYLSLPLYSSSLSILTSFFHTSLNTRPRNIKKTLVGQRSAPGNCWAVLCI